MKKLIIAILTLAMLFSLCSAEQLSGGWAVCTQNTIPAEALSIFETAVEGITGCEYDPVLLLGTQIVAGTNYSFLCRITPVYPDAETYWANVIVYCDLEGNTAIIDEYYIEIGISDYDEYEYRTDLVIISDLLDFDSMIDFTWNEDWSTEDVYMLMGGYVFVNTLRTPFTEEGYISTYTEQEFLEGRYGELKDLTISAYDAVAGYPAKLYSFTSGSEEDTQKCDVIIFHADEYTFMVCVNCDADAYYGYTDTDASEIQCFADEVFKSIKLVIAAG